MDESFGIVAERVGGHCWLRLLEIDDDVPQRPESRGGTDREEHRSQGPQLDEWIRLPACRPSRLAAHSVAAWTSWLVPSGNSQVWYIFCTRACGALCTRTWLGYQGAGGSSEEPQPASILVGCLSSISMSFSTRTTKVPMSLGRLVVTFISRPVNIR